MNNKQKTVCFSGHRILHEPKEVVEKSLEIAIRQCISEGAETFMIGGALGADTIAAWTVIRLRKEFPEIRLMLALPCPAEEQTLKWPDSQREEYRNILNLADEVKVLSDTCMLDRNRYMVDNSGTLIYYLRSSHGGTMYTANYAQKCGKVKLVAI